MRGLDLEPSPALLDRLAHRLTAIGRELSASGDDHLWVVAELDALGNLVEVLLDRLKVPRL